MRSEEAGAGAGACAGAGGARGHQPGEAQGWYAPVGDTPVGDTPVGGALYWGCTLVGVHSGGGAL